MRLKSTVSVAQQNPHSVRVNDCEVDFAVRGEVGGQNRAWRHATIEMVWRLERAVPISEHDRDTARPGYDQVGAMISIEIGGRDGKRAGVTCNHGCWLECTVAVAQQNADRIVP